MPAPLFIGRFQPFHNGHFDVVKKILAKHGSITIGIGSSEKVAPLTFDERKELILACFPEAQIFAIPDINDIPHWAAHVDKIVPTYDTIYTGSDIVKESYSYHPETKIINIQHETPVSATQIREAISKGEPWQELVPKITIPLLEKFITPLQK